MRNPLRVEFGSIYHESGMMYDNIGVIIDKQSGLYKWDSLTGPHNIKDYYNEIQTKYRQAGLSDIADNLLLVEFDRYEGILSMEEVCTFLNYMIQCSANGQAIMKILAMSEDELHAKMTELQSYGY